jgi:peptide/nickel transport system substrate-binding protein
VGREGQTTRCAANEKYYGGRPPLDEYFATFVGDANTRLLSLLNGEADLIDGIEPEQY